MHELLVVHSSPTWPRRHSVEDRGLVALKAQKAIQDMLDSFFRPRIATKDNMSVTAYNSRVSRYAAPSLSDFRLLSSRSCSVGMLLNSIIVNTSPMAINMKTAIA